MCNKQLWKNKDGLKGVHYYRWPVGPGLFINGGAVVLSAHYVLRTLVVDDSMRGPRG